MGCKGVWYWEWTDKVSCSVTAGHSFLYTGTIALHTTIQMRVLDEEHLLTGSSCYQ